MPNPRMHRNPDPSNDERAIQSPFGSDGDHTVRKYAIVGTHPTKITMLTKLMFFRNSVRTLLHARRK